MSAMKGANVALVHGFNVKDNGHDTTDKFSKPLKTLGATPHEFDYGWTELVGVRTVSPRVAQSLADWSKPRGPVIAIGHSNGANIVHQAAVRGARISVAVLINPALRRDTRWPSHVKKVLCFHCESDVPVLMSRLLHYSPFQLLWGRHPWGSAGRHGFKTKDNRVVNIDWEGRLGVSDMGHSGGFSTEVWERFHTLVLDHAIEAWT